MFFYEAPGKNTVSPWGFEKGHNTLATWCEGVTHLKRPWCWERLKAGGEGDDRGWDGWMASPTQWIWVGDEQGGLACCSPWGHKELDTTERLNWTELTVVGAEGLRPPAGCYWSWLVKAWYPPSQYALESQLSQHGWISMSQGSAHECFTRPSPSWAFTWGTGVIDYPQNCGQKSSNRSVCASSLLQTRRLCPTPPTLGDGCHTWLSCDVFAAGLGPWVNDFPSRNSSA